MEIIISFLSVTAIIGWLLVGYLLYKLWILTQDFIMEQNDTLNDIYYFLIEKDCRKK